MEERWTVFVPGSVILALVEPPNGQLPVSDFVSFFFLVCVVSDLFFLT